MLCVCETQTWFEQYLSTCTLLTFYYRITKEYRHELVERVKKIAENSKDIIRHIRSKYIKELNAVKNKASKDAVFECTNKVNYS